MKICIVGDVHWSTYSSIVRKRGDKYSARLENLISSINWAENYAASNNADKVVYLGDFFDKESLNSEEITALSEINWSNISHTFITGNHEVGAGNLDYASCTIFASMNNYRVIKEVVTEDNQELQIVYLPYELDSKNVSLSDIISELPKSNNRIIFSHNDIKGVQMGQFISTSGYDISDIENNCKLFINGHLHNGTWVTDKILNVGNLTGQNFSEDAFTYKHNIFMLDTETLQLERVENPHAMNFYKLNAIKNKVKLDKLYNAVITLTCYEEDAKKWKDAISESKNILESRVLLERNKDSLNDIESTDNSLTTQDHLMQFETYVLENIGNSDIIKEELQFVLQR